MALSGPTAPGSIRITAEGLPSALHLAQSVPDRILPATVEDTLDELVRFGIDLMSINIINTIRTEKSRGVLAESVQGDWRQTSGSSETTGGTYEVEIGSALPYAGYASREIGMSTINRNVLIHPGRWRFIGIRGPIPKHPFLEQTLGDLHKSMFMMLGGHFSKYVGEVQREVDTMGAQIE